MTTSAVTHRYRVDVILDEHEHLCEIRLAIGETVMIVNDFKLLTVQSEELETYAYTAEVGYV